MRRLLLVLLLLVACKPPKPPAVEPSVAERELARADELARMNQLEPARELYRKVVRDNPKDPTAAQALYALGLLYVDPKGPLRNYPSARVAFDRLATEHPSSPHAAEARAWSAALRELQQYKDQATGLRQDLEHLKKLDLELERRRH